MNTNISNGLNTWNNYESEKKTIETSTSEEYERKVKELAKKLGI